MPPAPNFGTVVFNGTFRDYQQTVLEHADRYLEDGKLHIVAAPGSGKTVLGLELIRRLNAPALVLSPSVTIRQQWGDRFEERFLPEQERLEDYVSFDLKRASLITSVTYQALHAASHHLIIDEPCDLQAEGEEENARAARTSEALVPMEEVSIHEDFSAFDLVVAMKEAGIKVLCLDEAHHLRSEWHKALISFIKAMGEDLTIIALTATPPYDSTPAEWKRYVDLCGPIDEEIFVPELVMKQTLCPHQDYLYFSFPTETEKEALKHYRRQAQAFLDELQDQRLVEEILAAAGIFGRFSQVLAEVLKNEAEFITLFRMAQRFGIELPFHADLLLIQRGHYKKTASWRKSWQDFENALQFVMDTPELFTEEISERVRHTAAQYGLVERRKLRLLSNKKLSRELVSSMGKLQGLSRIVISEQSHMKDSLRMLILTDYIRKEQLHIIGTDAHISTMGAVPIFECVRRVVGGASRIALLSGSLVIVPNASMEGIAAIARQKELACSFRQLPGVAYSEAVFQGSNKNKVAVMTEAFQQGLITILIGTKSLLGEGWDSPCINSLILATFVGSFMLSNQMRGRAIRVDRKVPDKTANIWHLVTLEPVLDDEVGMATKLLFSDIEKDRELDGDDWETIVRRFDCFMGPAYSRAAIESGVERIDILTPPFDRSGIDRINLQMMERANDREKMAESWRNASPVGFYPVVETASEFIPTTPPTSYILHNSLPLVVMLITELLLGLGAYSLLFGRFITIGGVTYTIALLALMVAMAVLAVSLIKGFRRLSKYLSPKKTVTTIAEAMLASLRQAGHVKSLGAKIRVTATPSDGMITFGLRQATIHEQQVFAEAMGEMLSPIENPKYVLVKGSKENYQHLHSYACPTILASNKEDAQLLRENLGHLVGEFDLVYTRTMEGREVLWKCCCFSYTNLNTEIIKKLVTWTD